MSNHIDIKKSTLILICATLGVSGALAISQASKPQAANVALDLEHQQRIQMTDLTRSLDRSAVILVGEHHTNPDHHDLQLQVIASLVVAGHKVAVGLEMFRRDSQADLDRWVAGKMSEAQMQALFFRNWSFDWALYRSILVYARDQQVPLIALNVSPDLTRQVASEGFESLSKAQKGALSEITCNVDDRYREFIKRSYGAHGHGQMNFENFCEAQMVWDDAMALHVVEFLDKHPRHKVVVLAGSGHVRKSAIPTQILKRVMYPLSVVLPYTQGSLDPEMIDFQDADYIVYPPYLLP